VVVPPHNSTPSAPAATPTVAAHVDDAGHASGVHPAPRPRQRRRLRGTDLRKPVSVSGRARVVLGQLRRQLGTRRATGGAEARAGPRAEARAEAEPEPRAEACERRRVSGSAETLIPMLHEACKRKLSDASASVCGWEAWPARSERWRLGGSGCAHTRRHLHELEAVVADGHHLAPARYHAAELAAVVRLRARLLAGVGGVALPLERRGRVSLGQGEQCQVSILTNYSAAEVTGSSGYK
jgi:hypothetical protein